MGDSSKSPQKKGPQRFPAPSLFVGPPSRNASQNSLHLQLTNTAPPGRNPPTRQRSGLGESSRNNAKETSDEPPTPFSATFAPFSRRQQQQQQAAELQSTARSDAIWAEMQNTLEEVELNAASGAKLFGPNHSAALDDLRTAQIALAQAWTRTEADETATTPAASNQPSQKPFDTANLLADDYTGKAAVKGRPVIGADGNPASGKGELEEETETDVEMARQRREANDKYFQRVESGVRDVVEKLEVVAAKMKGVERETREIWGEASADGSFAGSVT